MSDGHLTVDSSDGIGWLTITNPSKRNALSVAMWKQIPLMVDRLNAEPSVRIIILIGAGDTFCSGADIDGFAELIQHPELPVHSAGELATSAKPVLSAIDGYCVGGGVQLATATDLRICTQRARFAITPAKLGYLYPPSAQQSLVRLVGPAAAKYLLFSAELIDAEHALRIGLVDQIVPHDQLRSRVSALAQTISSRSQVSVQGTKAWIDAISAGTFDPELVAHWDGIVHDSPDLAEGIAAFSHKRSPQFTWPDPAQ